MWRHSPLPECHRLKVRTAHRYAEAEKLIEVYRTWDPMGDSSYDSFADMLHYAAPELPDREIVRIFKLAIDESTDMVAMARIEGGAQVCH